MGWMALERPRLAGGLQDLMRNTMQSGTEGRIVLPVSIGEATGRVEPCLEVSYVSTQGQLYTVHVYVTSSSGSLYGKRETDRRRKSWVGRRLDGLLVGITSGTR